MPNNPKTNVKDQKNNSKLSEKSAKKEKKKETKKCNFQPTPTYPKLDFFNCSLRISLGSSPWYLWQDQSRPCRGGGLVETESINDFHSLTCAAQPHSDSGIWLNVHKGTTIHNIHNPKQSIFKIKKLQKYEWFPQPALAAQPHSDQRCVVLKQMVYYMFAKTYKLFAWKRKK